MLTGWGRCEVSARGVYESPIGKILIFATDSGVKELRFADEPDEAGEIPPAGPPGDYFAGECEAQLDLYFSGRSKSFDVALDLRGTRFQVAVWRALLMIPFGDTWSYGRIAALVGRPRAARAVGGANHRNPVAIIVPCHRVIGGDGSLTGYGGGLWRKEWLLDHERRCGG
jgi:methylated-DNA-[protein]-cysteine S-methyltransferase